MDDRIDEVFTEQWAPRAPVRGTPRFAQMSAGAKVVVFALGAFSGVIAGGALALLVLLFRAAIVWAWGLA